MVLIVQQSFNYMHLNFSNTYLRYDPSGRKRKKIPKIKRNKKVEFKPLDVKLSYAQLCASKWRDIKSADDMKTHSCTKKESPVYTGSLVVGIATMHKSNAVPVINKEQATDIARMRR